MEKQGKVFPRDFNTAYREIIRAEGIYLYDKAGKEYIDGCSGALISNMGHCVPEIIDSITAQMRTLDFAHPSRWETEAAREAVQAIAEITPGDLNYVWFVSGGSEAVESAVKFTRQYFVEKEGEASPRSCFIGRWNSYHGATLGTMAVGGNLGRRKLFEPLFKEHPKISAHYCYRCPYGKSYPGCGLPCAEELEQKIKSLGPENVAAFIAEPIVGSTVGALVPPPEYWPRVREICDKYGIFLIADEIMTGLGRTGRAFCVNHWDVVPDIIVSAKGMAAGYVPTGGVFIRDSLVEVLKSGSGKFQHGFTYNSNPISAAAVRAVLGYIKKHNIIENARIQGNLLGKLLMETTSNPIVGEVRGKGLMYGFELVMDQADKTPFPKSAKAAAVVTEECLNRGLVIYPGGGMVDGTLGDNFLLAPPLVVREDQIRKIASVMSESLLAASKRLLPR